MVKEKIWDKVQYDPNVREESIKYGSLAYDISYAVAEELMKVGTPFVFESNFCSVSAEMLRPLVETYRYTTVTVLLDADVEVLYQRFIARETTPERHPGLRSNGYYTDRAVFVEAAEKFRHFRMGENHLTVDTTDFATVNYVELLEKVQQILYLQKPMV